MQNLIVKLLMKFLEKGGTLKLSNLSGTVDLPTGGRMFFTLDKVQLEGYSSEQLSNVKELLGRDYDSTPRLQNIRKN